MLRLRSTNIFTYIFLVFLQLISCHKEFVHVIRNLRELYSFTDPELPNFLVIQPFYNHFEIGNNDSDNALLLLKGPGTTSLNLSYYFGDIDSIVVMYRTNLPEKSIKISYVLSDGESVSETKSGAGRSTWKRSRSDQRQLMEVKVAISTSDKDKTEDFLMEELEIISTRIDTCSKPGYFASTVNPGQYYFCIFSNVYDRWLMTRFKCPVMMGIQQIFDEVNQKCMTPLSTTTTAEPSTTNPATTMPSTITPPSSIPDVP